jgi:hypothetical protein
MKVQPQVGDDRGGGGEGRAGRCSLKKPMRRSSSVFGTKYIVLGN